MILNLWMMKSKNFLSKKTILNYKLLKDSGIEGIAKIPSHWEVKKIKYLTKVRKETSTNGEEELLSVTESRGIVKRRELKSDDDNLSRSEDLSGYRIVHKGDLVNNIMLVWKRGLGVSKYDGIVSPAYSVFSFKKNCIPEYFNYLFRTDEYVTEFTRNSTGIIMSRLRLYDDSFGSIFSLLPPLKEQQLIAQYLDKKTYQIDSLIEKINKKIQILKEHRIVIINQYLTKGLEQNSEMKDSGIEWIGLIPAHWNVDRVGRTTYVKGRIGWKGLRSEDFIDEGPFLITGTDFHEGSINWKNTYHVNTERYEEDPFIILKEDDVLITKDGSIGKVAYVNKLPGPTTLNSGIFVTRPLKNKYLQRYFFWIISSNIFKEFIDYNSSGSTILHLYQNVFERFFFPLPPDLDEQKKISNILDKKITKIDLLIKKHYLKIDKLKEYRNSLISTSVTGKIRITEEMI